MLSKYLVSKLPGNSHLLISENLILKLNKYAQKQSNLNESGGVLIGCIRGEKDIELTQATYPEKDDYSSRCHFIRRGCGHIDKTLRAWEHSNGTETYLGEWHTHPESMPSPSSLDVQSWRENLPKRKMILIIIGTKKNWLGYWDGIQSISKLNCGSGLSF